MYSVPVENARWGRVDGRDKHSSVTFNLNGTCPKRPDTKNEYTPIEIVGNVFGCVGGGVGKRRERERSEDESGN